MTRSTGIRAATLLPLLVAVCLSLWTVSSSAATARNVPTQTEAWYQASPTDLGEDDPSCALPTGCAPKAGAPANPYPEGTLHVGVAGGRDTARTFITLDLDRLPDGALLDGGTLTLPVLDGDSGSMRPDAATISACPVAEPIEESHGGQPDEAPEFSCTTAAQGTFNEGDQPTITVDLGPIAAMLTTGGIAIVPSQEARDAGETWRVAFPTRDSEAADAAITAKLTYQQAPSFDAGLPGPSAADAAGGDQDGVGRFADGGFAPADGGGGSSAPGFDDLAPAAAPAEPEAAGPQEPIAAGAPMAAPAPMVAVGYAYPAVWLAPLVLVGVAGALARSLSGEIVLPEPASGGTPAVQPGLVDRLIAALRPPASSSVPPPATP